MKKTRTAILRALPSLLLFEAVYKILSICIFLPAGKELIRMMMDINGDEVLYNYGMLKLLFSLPGIAAAVLVLGFSAVLVYFEYSVIIIRIYRALSGTYTSFKDTVRDAAAGISALGNKGIIGFFLYGVLLVPFVHIGLVSALVPSVHIPYFMTGELLRRSYGEVLLNTGYAMIYVFYFISLFTIPVMVLEQKNFFSACKASLVIWKKVKFPAAAAIGLMSGLWALVFLTGLIPTDFASLMEENVLKTVCTIFFSFDALKRTLLAVLIWVLQTLFVLIYISVLVYILVRTDSRQNAVWKNAAGIEAVMSKTQNAVQNMWTKLYDRLCLFCKELYLSGLKKAVLITLLAAVVFTGMYSYAQDPPAVHSPVSIGHRCSDLGVENTLEALQGAIDSGADYAEIDIQLTKDGVPVIHHDNDLQRLAGTGKSVGDYTLRELKRLELKQNDMTGSIATLQEMMDACGDKIKLLIELKASSGEKELMVKTVLDMIKKNGFQDKCMIMSLDYDLVRLVRRQDRTIPAGYCLFANLGTMDTSDVIGLDVDFLVIEEGMVSKEFTAACRRAWIPVYVWTVDDRESMDKYLEMGIDGIISDKPYVTKEALDNNRVS